MTVGLLTSLNCMGGAHLKICRALSPVCSTTQSVIVDLIIVGHLMLSGICF